MRLLQGQCEPHMYLARGTTSVQNMRAVKVRTVRPMTEASY